MDELELEASNGSSSEFERRLQRAIEDTLALLGPIGKHKFRLKLKDEFNLELTGLASDPERLSSVLDQTLGPAGQVVGRTIARKIAAAYTIDLREYQGETYADQIRNLKQIVSGARSPKTAERLVMAHEWNRGTRTHKDISATNVKKEDES